MVAKWASAPESGLVSGYLGTNLDQFLPQRRRRPVCQFPLLHLCPLLAFSGHQGTKSPEQSQSMLPDSATGLKVSFRPVWSGGLKNGKEVGRPDFRPGHQYPIQNSVKRTIEQLPARATQIVRVAGGTGETGSNGLLA